MAERALVLSVDKWEMADERTGEIRKGLSVWYVNEYREDSDEGFGYKPTKVSADLSLLDTFRKAKLPSMCEMNYGSRPGAQGKATLTLTEATIVANLNLFNPVAKASA